MLYQELTTTFSIEEVENSIKNAKSAAGLNGLNLEDLTKVPNHVKLLTTMYNLWLVEGRIPKDIIHGRTGFIPKGGDDKQIANWRPITVGELELRLLEE